MLKTKEADRRWGSAMALGNLRPPPKSAVPALVDAMKDSQSTVRRHAAEALGRYDGPEGEAAMRALLAAMGDQDFWVRSHAGRSLARYGEAAALAVPVIIRLLRTEDRNLRREAAKTLGEFGPSAGVAIAALLVALDDEVDHVREATEKALNAVSPIKSETADEAFEALRRGDVSQRRAAVCDLVRPGSAAQEEVDTNALVEALRGTLSDPAPNVRATAAAALGRLGRPADAAIPSLLAAMKDEAPGFRVLSATALGRVAPGHREAIEALCLALTEDLNVNVRNAAAAGLGSMGPKAAAAAPAMIRVMNDRDGTVRVHVIVALGRIGPADGSVASALKTMAEQDTSADFRIWAIRALGLIGAKSDLVVPTLVKMLDDANDNIRNAAAYQLGEIRPTGKVCVQERARPAG
jgi:HEAT repeat protein